MRRHDEQPDVSTVFTEDRLTRWRGQFPSLQSLKIPDKAFLYRQGESCPFVFLIVRGIVKQSCLTEQGNEWTVALLRQGDIAGGLPFDSLLTTMEDSAQAVGEVRVIRLELAEFRGLLSRHPAALWRIFEAQCRRRRQAERKLLNILALPVEDRVVEMLKELANLFGIRCAHGFALEIRLTQQELADLVGASRSVVSTIMNGLRDRGILDYTRELICIKDDLFS